MYGLKAAKAGYTEGSAMQISTRAVERLGTQLALFVFVFILTAGQVYAQGDTTQAASLEAQKPYKVLHIMSYHSPWRWTDWQLEGFKDGLGDIDAQYKVFQMNAKQQSSPEQIEEKARQARALIDEWKPDLVYTTDDEAQGHVVRHYVGSDIPFVFSGVNKEPKSYGFEGSKNITGVMEHEHFVESVRLLQAMVPGAKRLAVVFDESPMWPQVQKRMRERVTQLPGAEFAAWDVITTFEEYKRKVRDYQNAVDAIALIGIFNFKDENGVNVPYQEVLKWTAENSRLPDFGYWVDRIHYGTLLSVTVSEREQGRAAGRMARAILVDGKSPADIPMTPTAKGLPVISLARAEKLGIKVKSGLLLSAEVVKQFEWDR
jgi:ABC-type uncharacterized transport system substrate-binding protein